MMYAEASYPFPGTTPHHFQHIAAYFDALKQARKERDARIFMQRVERARFGRAA